jgi:hypothetical protein
MLQQPHTSYVYHIYSLHQKATSNGPYIKQYPISKITNAKRTSGAAQVVKWLLSKCKALSSTPVQAKKKEKKKKLSKCPHDNE